MDSSDPEVRVDFVTFTVADKVTLYLIVENWSWAIRSHSGDI